MGVVSYLGKGLREPVSPYRTAYFFGAELNSVSADGWWALPVIVDPTTAFDLSTIKIYQEVVVALINVSASPKGTVYFNFKWYKDQPRTLLFEFNWSFYCPEGGWCYSYAYIGWTPWEINANGAYHVDVTVSGAVSHSRTIDFTVSGIPVAPTPPPAPAQPVTTIIEHLNSVSAFFYSLYTETLNWVWPFWLVATPFYNLSWTFSKLAWAFYYFNDWVTWVTNNIGTALSWSTIRSWIISWLPNLESAITWWGTWYTQVTGVVSTWWGTTQTTVQGWIDIAVAPFAAVKTAWDNFWQYTWPQWTSKLDSLKASWDSFWTTTLPTLVSFAWLTSWWNSRLADISALIDSAFVLRNSLWAGWQEIKGKVFEFFADPLEWLWGKFADWFLGPEV